ncbi:MAG: dihydrofolate synthase / folylpolyglutamate synthase [Solirubrobacteraceae bacterium]|nr:dihydrofolate synthase / folylpolyglutamate synthase [Solirubrobacteraceae bacterium]
MTGSWSYERAERHLRSLELFGMRFGLDRMHRLMTALEAPQRRFESIHVVGTNGKSSTARMIAAILERHGRRAGAYLSPHLVSFTERVQVSGRPVGEGQFAAAVQRAAHAAELVDRTLAEGDRVTQFELLTAAAYVELARSGVDVAVIEAGLGGRFDATNVIPSRVQVLTNIGLEHTRWLGPTVVDIAREKLAVVREGATLVVGPLDAEVAAEARAAAARERARLVAAGEEGAELPLAARGSFQRRNFALARAAAEAFVGELDPAAVAAVAAEVTVPGRCEVVAENPLTIYDGAHNPAGMQALVESLPELAVGTPTVAVLSILDDKDAAGMLGALLPACDAVVFTASSNARALPPPTLQSLARQLGFERQAEPAPEPDPSRAVRRARELAGEDGVVLATGSIYLVADLARSPGALRASLP